MSSSWLRINGVPATEIAPHTPPAYETEADGGCATASFAFALSRKSQHPALKRDALVEVMRGPMPVWSGVLTEPDRTTWQCQAVGLWSTLNDYLALDLVTGSVTRNIATAMEFAQDSGAKVLNPDFIAGGFVAYGELPANPESVAKVWSDYATQEAKRVGVNGQRVIYVRADPTAPTLMAAPGTALFGQTSESTPKRLAGRYFNGATDETAFAGSGAPQADVGDELIRRGTLTMAEAEWVLEGMLKNQGPQAWTNGVTLHRDQLMTMGGQPANLGAVRAGQMIRAQGLAYADAASGIRLDVVIGKTRYDEATPDVIYVEPVNTVPRDVRSVIGAA